MARRPRVDPPGSWHHVMNRGANHQLTFMDDVDRDIFLAVLKSAVSLFGIEIHSYCLMPNHYHLLVRSPKGQLSRSMKFIGQSYTQRFNRRHDRDGALFRGRFHNNLVDSENYLHTVGRYIHRNPVLESMKDDSILDTYQWSSLAVYENRARRPEWLTTNEIRSGFATASDYRDFVRDCPQDVEIEQEQAQRLLSNPFRPGIVLGDKSFLQSIVDKVGETAERFRPWIVLPPPELRRPITSLT